MDCATLCLEVSYVDGRHLDQSKGTQKNAKEGNAPCAEGRLGNPLPSPEKPAGLVRFLGNGGPAPCSRAGPQVTILNAHHGEWPSATPQPRWGKGEPSVKQV